MGKCPECGSSRIEQYRMPYGPIWCRDCGFRVEDKTAVPNPFLDAADEETATQPQPSLGAALSKLSKAAQPTPADTPPDASQGSSKNSDPESI